MASDQSASHDPPHPAPAGRTTGPSPMTGGSARNPDGTPGRPSSIGPTSGAHMLYPQGGPDQAGPAAGLGNVENQSNNGETMGSGVEGEVDIWQARYSMRNFVGRGIGLAVLIGVWLYVAIYNRDKAHDRMSLFTISFGVVTLVLALWLGIRMLVVRYSLYYRLTNRRIFHSSGLLHRRRDQLELLRVKDVFTRQNSVMERILKLGTVAVVPNDKELPTFFFNGVSDPKQVMDLIWDHTRAEHDHRSVKVEQA